MKNILPILVILLIGTISFLLLNQRKNSELLVVEPSVTKTEQKTYIDLEPKEAYELIQNTPDLVIIDVSPKYEEGHLPGAINYYIGDGSLAQAIPNLDKDLKYLVYCHVDSASIPGAQMLVDAGIKDVYRLKGNYSAWVNAGYEIES